MAKGKPAPKFFEVNGHNGCVNQVDNGLKMVKNLIKMMDIRTKIEEKYAAELEKFSQTQRKLFGNMYENEHTKHVVMELITEADCTAHVHRQSRKRVFDECITKAKEFEKETWDKGFFGASKQQSGFAKQFATAQKSWATTDKQYRQAKSKYDQACKAVITQQQIVANHETNPDDPKLEGAKTQLSAKENTRNSARDTYQEVVNKMDEMRESYTQAMTIEYEGMEKFEKERVNFTRKLLQDFRHLAQPKAAEDMKVMVKGIQKGDDLEIELTRKVAMIDQAVSQHSTESSMGQFKSTLGPLNSSAMEWPVFREYDPEAEAAKSKIAGQAGSNEVATNEMSGTYQPSTNDAPMYVEPPPVQDDYEQAPMGQSNQGYSQDWPEDDDEPAPEQEPEPVVMDLGGRGGDDSQETVTALYDYTKDDEDELSFLEGDEIVKLSEPTDEGWCQGRLVKNGEVGLFPVQYVDLGEAEA